MKSLRLFRNPIFRYFFLASMIGLFGEGIFALTGLVILSKDSGSVMNIGYMFLITMLPSVFLAPFGGVWIDKYNKATIAILMNVARFVTILGVAVLAFLDILSIEFLYLSIFFSYIAWYLLVPATESMLKEVLDEDEYIQGVSFIQAAWQVGLFSSALLAGTLLKYAGTTVTLLVAALTYAIGALLFWRISEVYRKPVAEEATLEGGGVKEYMGDIRQGFRYLLHNKKIFWFSLAACLVAPFFTAINILIAPFNYQVLNGNEMTLGAIDSAAGIGSLISVAFCVYIAKSRGISMYLIFSIILLSASTWLFSLTEGFWTAFAMYLLIGLFIGNMKVLSKSLIYQHVEPSFVGRTMTSISMLSLSLAIVSSLVVGYLGERSLTLSYLVVALTLVIGILFVLLGVRYMRLEQSKERVVGLQEETTGV